MDHIKLQGCPNRVANRGFTEVEVIGRKRRQQLVDVFQLERGNDVDVLSKARLAVGDAGERPNNQLRHVHTFERFNRVSQDIDLLHDLIISAGIRGVAARPSNRRGAAERDCAQWFEPFDERRLPWQFVPPGSWPPEPRHRRDR